MKVLFISNLFPDAKNPHLGIYNAQCLKHLSKLCDIRVLAPRPTRGFPPIWFPKKFSAREEDSIFHPIFPAAAYLPKIGSRFNHKLMASSIELALKAVRKKFPFDVVLSSWIYPDSCAVAELAARNNFPFVAIAQGSDVHQYLKMPVRRKIISTSLAQASAIVARSENLAGQLVAAGVDPKQLHLVYNGVDSRVFHPANKNEARRVLGFREDATILLFTGNFLPIKNPLLLVEAHAALCHKRTEQNFILVMIGTGPLLAAVKQRAGELGTSQRVMLVGEKSSSQVAQYMQTADLLCVPSDNEGVPNVILEALASGLRVVGRSVGGIPEILRHDFLGKLVPQNEPSAMADAILEVLSVPSQPERIAQHAARFSWEAAAQSYYKLLQAAANVGIAK